MILVFMTRLLNRLTAQAQRLAGRKQAPIAMKTVTAQPVRWSAWLGPGRYTAHETANLGALAEHHGDEQ